MNKKYWPFETIDEQEQTKEHKAQIAWMQSWLDLGFRPYMFGSNLGVEDSQGNTIIELIYRGSKGWETLVF